MSSQPVIPRKIKGTILVTLVVFLGGAYIKDEIHNHTPQGKYELCVHEKDAAAYRAGMQMSGADLAITCQQETGYDPARR